MPAGAIARLGSVRFWNEGDYIAATAFTPDGRYLICLSDARRRTHALAVFDASNGRLLRTFGGRYTTRGPLALSPDGRLLAVEDGAQDFILWDVATGRKLRHIKQAPKYGLTGLAFSPNGKKLAGTFLEFPASVWDIATGRVVDELAADSTGLEVLFSRDGKTIITIGVDGRIRYWDTAGGKQRSCWRLWDPAPDKAGLGYEVHFSPDERTVASAAYQGPVRVWDTRTRRLLHEFHRKDTHTFAFSPRGDLLAFTGSNATVRFWDLAKGKEIHALNALHRHISSLAFSPGGHRLAVAGSNLVTVWDLRSRVERPAFVRHTDNVASVAMIPDGKTV
ncbi:MAG TPA: hypothetical protein VFA18_08695, partial [Gemmataceae bacterium]|nr:hypothetical protein [Gemmataceae bacterium]